VTLRSGTRGYLPGSRALSVEEVLMRRMGRADWPFFRSRLSGARVGHSWELSVVAKLVFIWTSALGGLP
jgi:hypothetical protein